MYFVRFVSLSLLVLLLGHDLAGAMTMPGSMNPTQLQINGGWQYQPVYASSVVNTVNSNKKGTIAAPDKKGTKPGPSKEALRRRKLLKSEPSRTQKAWLYSAIFPGLGQAYNRKYWKLGVFYGGFALATALAVYHHKEYQETKRELIELKGKSPQNPYTSLTNYVQGQKRERNMYLYFISLWYILNIFDAYVDGTLKTFDVSDNLEVIIEPTAVSTTQREPAFGLGVSLHFKP